MARAIVHFIDPLLSPAEQPRALLSGDERARADRFVSATHAHRWTIYRASLRTLLGESLQIPAKDVPLISGSKGKPSLAPPYHSLEFNLSHTDDLAVLITSTDGAVGIDLEPLERAASLLECASSFCHPEELDSLATEAKARASALLKLWTAKESLLKALGNGLSFPPTALLIRNFTGVASLPGIESLQLQRPQHPRLSRYEICVAIPSHITELSFA